MNLKEFWEKPHPLTKWSIDIDLSKVMMDDLVDWISEFGYLSILDIGSGSGRLFTNLKRREVPVDLTMVDWSETGRKLCSDLTGVEPDSWDGVKLPYEDRTFDLVVMSDLLIHIRPEDVGVVCIEAKRVCKRFVYFNLTTREGDHKYSKRAWNFYHNDLRENLFYDWPLVKVMEYEAENPLNRLIAYILER